MPRLRRFHQTTVTHYNASLRAHELASMSYRCGRPYTLHV